MSDKPDVSIVLPTFDGARYLAEAIDSCLAQTYRRWELILVDDCSSDDTPGIVARYVARDPRIRSLRHRTNLKLPAALNTGFAAALGDYFTWTSDDNVYEPDALSEMLAVLTEGPEVDVVYADATHIDAQGRPVGDVVAGLPEELPFRNSVGACFLFRRRVFEDLGGYDEALFMAEDYDFWLRAWPRFCLLPHHRALYRYRLHSRSLSARQSAQARAVVRALDKNLPALDPLGSADRARAYLELAVRCRQVSDGPAARRNLLRALRLRPRTVFATRPTLLLGITSGVSMRAALRALRRRLSCVFHLGRSA